MGVEGASTSTEWRRRSGGPVQVCKTGCPGWREPASHSAPPAWPRARPLGWGGAVLDTVSTGGSRQALLPKTLILGVQDPWSASQGPRAGSERGPEGPAPGESQPGLTSVVSVSPTALFPLMAATLCSSCRPRSSLPMTRSHRADSASHLGQGVEGGEWEGGPHCRGPQGLATVGGPGPSLN